jgi:hypothetical protein
MRRLLFVLSAFVLVSNGGCESVPMLEEREAIDLTYGQLQPAGRFRVYASPHEQFFSGFIGTQRVSDPCSITASEARCDRFNDLPERGIIAYEIYGGGTRTWAEVTGDLATLAGREARILREYPGGCESVRGEESLTIFVRDPSRDDWYTAIEACLRGPDLPAREAELLAFLDSARLAPR